MMAWKHRAREAMHLADRAGMHEREGEKRWNAGERIEEA